MNTSDMSLRNARGMAGSAGTASRRTRGQAVLSVFNLLLTCVLSAAALLESSAATAAQTIVSLTFDDGLTQSPVRDILRSHGMKGTFYVNSNMIGTGGDYLTKAELDALYADGNEIGGHTINHVDLATLSDTAQRAAICNDLQTLNTWYPGQIHSFAYPYASTGPTTQSILAAGCPGVGQYTSARTVGGLMATDCPGCPAAESIPPGNPYYIQTHESVMSTTTLDQIKTWVTQAETSGGWVTLVFHNVCNGCSSYGVSPATLDAFLTWLQARAANNTIVRTVNQVMTGDAPPPPPPAPLGVNQLINPSLELDADANSQADCWERDAYGTNTGTWTRTTDAHADSFAERLQITAYSSGDRKLLPTLDAGQASGGCAPTIEAGASYQLGAWYKSTTPVTPVLFYRDSGGVWRYWRDGPLLPSSANWTQITFNPGAMPTGAQALSFGIALDSVGTLTTDDYSMRKVLDGSSDTTAPTVSLTAPAAGSVSGTVTVAANAADNVGVVGVQFRLDGVNLGTEDTASPYSISWNTTTATNGTHTLTAVARDAAGNTITSSAITVTVSNADTIAPTVSLTAPAAGSVTGTITVSANAADNVGVAGVQFRLDGVNLGAEDTASPYSISWNTTTATNGTHTLTAVARDAAGNTTTSSAVAVTVSNDTTAPTVSITAPPAGTVTGTVTVSANAADNVGVAGVQFRLDGINLGTEDTASPYSISWNTTTATNGTHTLTAVARDAAGNITTSSAVTVTVSNADTIAPTVSLTAPAAGSVTGTVTVSANAADNVGVVGVQFRLDGVNLGTEDTASPYSISWNTTTATNGTHTLTAVARDVAGNTATSSAVTVTVSNGVADTIPPGVSLTAPAAGTVTGTVAVSANATDNVGVAGVQFRLDGANLGTEDTASPYSISWDTTTATNGTHTLTAVARDAAGNTTTSSAVTVTVSNLSLNLVSNPSLEIDANSNGIPDCWQLGGYGTNTFVWTRVTSAHSGNFAESLQITSRSSGDRKLVQTQDAGACAPAVTPGARYTLSAWYTSTVPSAFVVFYRTSAGAWRYWTTSPGVAATTSWRQAVYTTPAIPAGATHLSFGLYLSTVGTLVTDDYSMIRAP